MAAITKNKPEKIIEREILIWLNRQPEAFFWKNDTVGIYDHKKGAYRKSPNPYSIRGISDIIGIVKKNIIFIEVKTATGKLSKFQQHFISKIRSLGGRAIVARSVEDVKEYFLKEGFLHESKKEKINDGEDERQRLLLHEGD